jgi:hypothetical protein
MRDKSPVARRLDQLPNTSNVLPSWLPFTKTKGRRSERLDCIARMSYFADAAS